MNKWKAIKEYVLFIKDKIDKEGMSFISDRNSLSGRTEINEAAIPLLFKAIDKFAPPRSTVTEIDFSRWGVGFKADLNVKRARIYLSVPYVIFLAHLDELIQKENK